MSPDWTAKEEGDDPVPYADLDDPQSLNLYSYVRNNPLSKNDPSGHCPECIDLFDEAVESPAGQAVGDWIESNGDAIATWGETAGAAGVAWASGAFQSTSATIRKEWEKYWGKPWPKDPATGKNQDVSLEPKAKADGGTDDVKTNIQPRPRKDHVELHKKNGDYKRWGKRGKKGSQTPKPDPQKPTPPSQPDPPKPDPPQPDPPKPQGS